MAQKIVLITGGNSGIGKACAIDLARLGWKIILLARNKERVEKARHEITDKTGNEDIDILMCDLSRLENILRAADLFKKTYPHLDVLINNAGVLKKKHKLVEGGIEQHFWVNHLSHFLLTQLLWDHLKKSESARIINLTSNAHRHGRIHFDNLNLNGQFRTLKAYSQSKLANVMFTYGLHQRLNGEHITVNCVHPGIVATRIVTSRSKKISRIIKVLFKLIALSPYTGASTPVYLASDPNLTHTSGYYFYKGEKIKSSKRSMIQEDIDRLWEVSLNMTGLDRDRHKVFNTFS